MKSAVEHLQIAQRELDEILLATPTGDLREKLSVVNIYLLAALKSLDRVPKPPRPMPPRDFFNRESQDD